MVRKSKLERLSRRDLLHAAAGAAALSLPACSTETVPQEPVVPSVTGPWGSAPEKAQGALLAQSQQPDGILEVFCLGGLSPWESFYTVPDLSSGGQDQYWTFRQSDLPNWIDTCGAGLDAPEFVPWVTDGAGRMVNLGPFIYPLRDRPDLLARMRVWVMHHDIEPHELAIPLAVTGHRPGNPKMASLGTHLQRFYTERLGSRDAPYSYSITMNAFSNTNNATGAGTVGRHRSWARPLEIQLGDAARLPGQLQRPGSDGFREALDTAIAGYQARFRQRLHSAARAEQVRAPGYNDYATARENMRRHAWLAKTITPELLKTSSITPCFPPVYGVGPDVPDETTTGLRVARRLLLAEQPAKYVQVFDSGLLTDRAGMGFDSHGEHVGQQGTNAAHMCRVLSDSINRPGENDPTKLDLDRHFVLLNTEFGRAPRREYTPANPDGGGTDHWPWGYVVVGFGGFVNEDRSGIVGSLNSDSRAVSGITPAEHRAALLLSMGCWPFTEESYNVGDMQDAQSELEAAMYLRRTVLGYST